MLKKMLSAFVAGFVITVIMLAQTSVSAAQVKFEGYEVPIDIDVNGSYLENGGKGYLDVNGITYVPVRFASEALGASIVWDSAAGDAVITTKSYVQLVFDPETQGCYVNGTWTYAAQRLENGVLYANANFLFPALGAQVGWDSYRYEVKVTAPGHTVPASYIESYYTPEDLYWLSKIVTCEAGSVSFNARVMVANVILNRRASDDFPDTVYGVIYDKKFGVQFPPAHSGKVARANPTTTTILACKAALNGLDLAPGCLYFNYASNKTGWVATHRPLYKIVGNQAFYR